MRCWGTSLASVTSVSNRAGTHRLAVPDNALGVLTTHAAGDAYTRVLALEKEAGLGTRTLVVLSALALCAP